MKKVLSLIKNADIKHATQLEIKYKNNDNSVIQIRVEKKHNLNPNAPVGINNKSACSR